MSRDINLLHPVLKSQCIRLRDLAKEKLGLNVIITQTLRSNFEQKALYAQGRMDLASTNELRRIAGLGSITPDENKKIVTKAQTSLNTFHGYGLAFDIAITDSTGKKIDWDNPDWNKNGKSDWDEVGRLGESIGLEWGGNWSGMYDAPHFQNRLGFTLAQLRDGTVQLT